MNAQDKKIKQFKHGKQQEYFLIDASEHSPETLARLEKGETVSIVLEMREHEGQLTPFFKCFTDQLPTRTFYIENRQEGHLFISRIKENGQTYKEYKNGQISQYCQSDSFGVLGIVSDLVNEGWKGRAIIYLSSALIAKEHTGNPDQEWYGFNEANEQELKRAIRQSKERGQKRWYYGALAQLKAKSNEIYLEIKHADKKNIKFVNDIMSHLLEKKSDRPKKEL